MSSDSDSEKQNPGCVVLGEILRALLNDGNLGYAGSPIDYSVLATTFLVAGPDGTLNHKPAMFKVIVERMPEACKHSVKVDYAAHRSVFAPYCECCLSYLGVRESTHCAACEPPKVETPSA